MARRTDCTLLLAAALLLPVGLAQAAYIEFGGLLGDSFSSPGGTTGYSLTGYGLAGITISFYGESWYSYSPGAWQPGINPSAYDPAGLYMVNYAGDCSLAVGYQAPNGQPQS